MLGCLTYRGRGAAWGATPQHMTRPVSVRDLHPAFAHLRNPSRWGGHCPPGREARRDTEGQPRLEPPGYGFANLRVRELIISRSLRFEELAPGMRRSKELRSGQSSTTKAFPSCSSRTRPHSRSRPPSDCRPSHVEQNRTLFGVPTPKAHMMNIRAIIGVPHAERRGCPLPPLLRPTRKSRGFNDVTTRESSPGTFSF